MGLFFHVVGGKIEVFGNFFPPGLRPRPIPAKESPLVRKLAWIAVGKTHSVACREKKRGGVVSPHEPSQFLLHRLIWRNRFNIPTFILLILRQVPGQAGNQFRGAKLRRPVIRVLHPEKGCPARENHFPLLGHHHASGILGVLFQGSEVNATHGILHVELVLKPVRDLFRIADQEQVIGNLFRVGRAGADPMARQEGGFRFARPVCAFTRVLSIIFSSLFLPQIQKFLESLLNGGCAVFILESKNNAPSCLSEVFGVHPLLGPQTLLGGAIMPGFELPQVVLIQGLSPGNFGNVFGRHGGK